MTQISFWDAGIVASTEYADCSRILSEGGFVFRSCLCGNQIGESFYSHLNQSRSQSSYFVRQCRAIPGRDFDENLIFDKKQSCEQKHSNSYEACECERR